MENQTQQLDPIALNIAKAIRQTETGGNYNAKGASGEHGAYQFTRPTWDRYAKQFGISSSLDNSTPSQQNEVAYKKVKEWSDNGYNVGQIASMWNAGDGEPNAYTGKFSDGSPSSSKISGKPNKYGAKYDVPAYATSVAKAYQTLKGGGQVSIDPNNPSSIAGTQMEKQSDPYGATNPASANDNLLTGGLKTIENIPSSALNLAKNLGSVIMHPLTTVKNIGDVLSGGIEGAMDKLGITQALGGQVTDTAEKQQAGAVWQGLKDRYGSLDNIRKTIEDDPTGFAFDVATILEGGGSAIKGASLLGDSSKIAELTAGMSEAEKASFIADLSKSGALGKGAEIGQGLINKGKVVNPLTYAGEAAGLIKKGLGRVASDTMGVVTGTGGETIRQGLQATIEGGDAYNAFKNGLKGNVDPEELVSQAQGALKEVIDNRSASYQKMLEGLKEDPGIYNPTPIQDTLNKQLNKFGIKETEKGLDFSRSKFALDKTAQGDITNLYELVKGWGSSEGDLSAVGVDNLKQIIDSYYSPNSNYRAITSDLRNSAKNVLKNAPGYTNEMKNYADASDWINDTRKGLSLGDKAMTETAFKKLTTAFKQNNEWRASALKELDDITGGQLKASIAGQQLSSIVPRGLAKFGVGLEGIEAMHAALTGGAGVIPLLASMMVSSPRLVGEFIKVLGLGTRGTKFIMNYLGKMNPSAVGVGLNIGQKVNSGILSK